VTETDLLSLLLGKVESLDLPLLVLVLWAELRFLPLVLDAIGWNRAIGAKLDVTEADMQNHRPRGITGLFRRTPNGGPPPAAMALALSAALFLAGCGSVPQAFLAGEEAAYSTLAPIVTRCVNEHGAYEEREAELIERTVQSWEFSLRQNRKALDGAEEGEE